MKERNTYLSVNYLLKVGDLKVVSSPKMNATSAPIISRTKIILTTALKTSQIKTIRGTKSDRDPDSLISLPLSMQPYTRARSEL